MSETSSNGIELAKTKAIEKLEKMKEKAKRKGDMQKVRQITESIMNLKDLK